MKNRLLAICAAALTVSSLSLLSTFAAADGKEYPGGVCVPTTGGLFNRFFGTADNTSSSTELNVFCAFVRDTGSITSASVRVFDRHSTIDVSCTLFHEIFTSGGNGQFFLTSSTKKSTGFGSALQSLSFGAVAVQGDADGDGGYYYATCSIPRTQNGNVSHVISFDINES
jgi:hypothetical protein